MSKKKQYKWLDKKQAKELGFKVKENERGRTKARYYLTLEQVNQLGSCEVKTSAKTKPNDYKKKFVLSAWNKKGFMMCIDTYCEHYKLPRKDITSYKLVSHTGTPYYNIVFKEKTFDVDSLDYESIIKRLTKKYVYKQNVKLKMTPYKGFDVLTYADVHIGMDTDSQGKAMYATLWDKDTILKSCDSMIDSVLSNQNGNTLIVDELGDFLDGYNSQTTRGGHHLPQNMTNEQAFDCALEFKIRLLDGLVSSYRSITFNNICNDNHAGSFGYFVNKAFKEYAELKYDSVNVVNHPYFLNHYMIEDRGKKIGFVITHGKDDSTLKFGFKPQLDSKGMEKLDQYCKQNELYKKCDLIVIKKGDSHQALFDMCTSDDFYYFNYHALSPSSQWVQNNFKKGRRGFTLENYKGTNLNIKPFFL